MSSKIDKRNPNAKEHMDSASLWQHYCAEVEDRVTKVLGASLVNGKERAYEDRAA